jgi:dihydrofolate reductase
MIRAIAAMSQDRVIGFQGQLPWKNKLDMRFFKAMTEHNDVVVGNTTFKSIGMLKNRCHRILSDNQTGNGIGYEYLTIKSLLKRIKKAKLTGTNLDDMWVIGGAKVYQQLLPLCSDLYLTLILDEYEGDVYMPEFEHLFDEQRIIKECKDIWFVHYWKNPNDSFEDAYRNGFDAKLMGLTHDDNPHELSGHERDTTYSDECNYQWYKGFEDAPIIKGFNDTV